MYDENELQRLLTILETGNIAEASEANSKIAKFGEAAVEPLIAILKDENKRLRWHHAIISLEYIGDPRAVEPLIKLLKNPLSFDALLARKYTAWALARLKDARAVNGLIEMLHDRIHEEDDGVIYDEPDAETIEAAAYALTEIGDPRALEPIINRIFEDDYWQNGETLQPWGESAVTLLLQRLDSDNELSRHKAAALLGEIGDKRAVEPLIQLLKTDPSDSARHGYAYALGELADSRAYDVLLAALEDSYEQTRAYAAMGLGKLKDERAIPRLKEATRDPHPLVQNFANWALGWIENAHGNERSGR